MGFDVEGFKKSSFEQRTAEVEVSEDMKEIVEMNVPSGFKRQRLMWEAINPDELPSVSGDGGAGSNVPTWAKNIIKPIKKALIPVLNQMKNVNIAAWAKAVWSNLSQLVAVQIPNVCDCLDTI